MSAILSGVRVGVITWPADVRGTMTTLQLPDLVLPSFLFLSSVCFMNSLSSGEHAVPSTAMLFLSAESSVSETRSGKQIYSKEFIFFMYILYFGSPVEELNHAGSSFEWIRSQQDASLKYRHADQGGANL